MRTFDHRILELNQGVLDKLSDDDTRVKKELVHYPDCCGPTLSRENRMFLQLAKFTLPKILQQLRRDRMCMSRDQLKKYLGKVYSAIGNCRPLAYPEPNLRWQVNNTDCIPFQPWEKLAHSVCDVTFDLKIFEPEFKNCDIEYTLALPLVQKVIDTCNLDLKVSVKQDKECEVDYKVYSKTLESANCSLSFSTYLQLLACGLSFDILSDLAACGIYITYSTKKNCPELNFGHSSIPVCDIDPVDIKLKP